MIKSTVRYISKYIGSIIVDSPLCVETGCMYVIDKDNLEHTTTNNIVENICFPNRGHLFSLDLDKDHITIAKSICSDGVSFIEGDSVASLYSLLWRRDIAHIDLLWLDSKEFDPVHAVNEFDAIKPKLRPDKHFILVDDIHNENSVKYRFLVPILKSLGYDFVEVSTPTGLFVSCLGYDLSGLE